MVQNKRRGGEVEFVTEEVKLVPEVQALLTLEYNKKEGDAQGRFKKRAKEEIKYLCLAYSTKSPYRDYSSKERLEEARKDCKFPADWEESTQLKLLIPKFIKGTKSKTGRLLSTVENFLEKFEAHLNSIDLNERNSSGGVVHDPAKVMTTLRQLPGMAQTIQELEQQVNLGLVGTPRSKGDHEIGWMKDGAEKAPGKISEEDEDD